MRDATVERVHGRPAAVYAACGASLLLGLLFIFVRAPHPWGWEGFDHYHDIALALARGHAFPTMEVPWGYAYFLAAFYRVFGDHPWMPLTVQAALNALVPLFVFEVAATWLDRRTAALAAVLTGVFSFNTVYASTQSSDAVCTCLFMAAIVAFVRARERDNIWLFLLVGALTGLAAQFRPNLILIPFVLAAFAVLERRTLRRVVCGTVVVAGAAAMLAPWVARNYRLTETWLPTSVHGGVQLWYGTLQTGEYLNSRAYNPRSVFDAPAFDYTSLDGMPLVVRASLMQCMPSQPSRVELRYWTDDDQTERILPPKPDGSTYTFAIPALHRAAVVYYFLTARWGFDTPEVIVHTPPLGARAPFVYFVSQDHLADLDRYGDLLDVFDLARLVRHDAWGEPVPFADRLAQAGITNARTAVARLAESRTEDADRLVTRLDHDDRLARLTLGDGSSLAMPKEWSGRITDLEFSAGLASNLITARRSLAAMSLPAAATNRRDRCRELEDVTVNAPFYRQEPHMMRRYSALAFDNIRRDPVGFLVASAYRAVRLFVIVGTSDAQTAQQFERSRIVYAAGAAASALYLVLFVGGVVIGYRRGDALWLPLLLILYVPATIAPVLTNMRYTVTVQPLIFMFVAVALTSLVRRRGSLASSRDAAGSRRDPSSGDPAAPDRAGTRTARQP